LFKSIQTQFYYDDNNIYVPIQLKLKRITVAVAYAENFHEGVFIQFHIVVICIWCVLFVTSQFDVIFIFPNQRFDEVSGHNMRILLNALFLFYKPSALQVRISEENKLNATTQQFTTIKISGAALEQGSKTHSSLRQSNVRLQNEAALSCRIRAVECWA